MEYSKGNALCARVEGFCPVPGGSVWYRIYRPSSEVGSLSAGALDAGRQVGGSGVGGAGGAGGGPREQSPRAIPLVMLHGGPGAPHDYLEPVAEAIAAGGRPALVYDQLGCGRSDRPSDTSLWNAERSVRELDALLDHLKIGRFHLLGQSWGGMLALLWVRRHAADGAGQERLTSLTLSGPLVSVSDWMRDQRFYLDELPPELRDAVSRAEASGDFSSEGYRRAMAEYYALHLCRLDPYPDCLTRSMNGLGIDVYMGMWGPSEFTCTGNLLGEDCAPVLDSLRVPALFTCGRYDEARPETIESYAARVPGAKIAVFENASHQHHLEAATQFLDVLKQHLDGAERSQREPSAGDR